MNNIFKVIFNHSTGTYQVVSELARGQSKSKSIKKSSQRKIVSVSLVTISALLTVFPNFVFAQNDLPVNDGTKGMSVQTGQDAKAGQENSVAIGHSAKTEKSGDETKSSVAIGANTTASGSQSIAIGGSKNSDDGAKAKGEQSIAIGADVVAKGSSSIAIGGDDLDDIANALGKDERVKQDKFGWGDFNEEKRKEFNDSMVAKHYLEKTGHYLVGDTKVEDGKYDRFVKTEATGQGSVVIGVQSSAKGDLATAIGTISRADGMDSTAFGVGAAALRDDSIALGAGSQTGDKTEMQLSMNTKNDFFENGEAREGAKGKGSKAEKVERAEIIIEAIKNGENNKIKYGNFAGGKNIENGGEQLSIGSIGYERQIKNVAPGAVKEWSTDAINGSQLYATNKVLGNVAGSVVNNFGGNATLTPEGGITFTNIGDTGADNIHDAIKKVNQDVYVHVNENTDTQLNGDSNDNKGKIDSKAGATGKYSVAIGVSTKAQNENTIAIGNVATATGKDSFAAGPHSKAMGEASIVLGRIAKANGERSIAIGDSTEASEFSSIALGRTAKSQKKEAIAIGNGADGNGEAAVALGRTSKVYGNDSIAIGNGARTGIAPKNNGVQGSGNYSIAIGRVTVVEGQNAVALGHSVQVKSNYATALGSLSQAKEEHSIAIGSNSIANQGIPTNSGWDINKGATGGNADETDLIWKANTAAVSIGHDGNTKNTQNQKLGSITRKIVNLAAGSADTDAVNVAQLKKVKTYIDEKGLTFTGNTGGDHKVKLNNKVSIEGAENGEDISVNAQADGNNAKLQLALQKETELNETNKQSTKVATSQAVYNAIKNAKSNVTGDNVIKVTGQKTDDVQGNTFSLSINDKSIDKTKINDNTVRDFEAKSRETVKGEGDIEVTVNDQDANKDNRVFTVKLSQSAQQKLNKAGAKVTAGNGITLTDLNKDKQDQPANYQIAVKPADETLVVDNNGVKVNTVTLMVNDGKIADVDNTNKKKLVNAGDISNAINQSGFKLSIGGNTGSVQNTNNQNFELIHPSDEVKIIGGDHITVSQKAGGITIATNNQAITESAQLPVVYTDKDGNKLTKIGDKFYKTDAEGNPVDRENKKLIVKGNKAYPAGTDINNITDLTEQVPETETINPSDIIASMNNADGKTSTATTLTNVKSTLAGTKDYTPNAKDIKDEKGKIVAKPANGKDMAAYDKAVRNAKANAKSEIDRTIPTITDSQKANAATVDDILQAGWNLRENDEARDFVKAYDTINFVNGQGTNVSIDTTANKWSEVKVNVNVDNLTVEAIDFVDGKKVVEAEDNRWYEAKPDGTPDKTKPIADEKIEKIKNTIRAKTVQLAPEIKQGASTPTGKIVELTGNDAKALVNAGDIAKAINNAGFNIVSSAEGGKVTGKNEDHLVKIGEKIELIAGEHITINQDGGKFKFSTNNQAILNDTLQAVVYTKADGTKVYKQPNGDFTTGKDGSGEKIKDIGSIITSIQSADGDTKKPTTLTNLAGNLDGAKANTTAPTTSAKLPEGDKTLNQNNAATVGDVLNAGFNLQNNGKAKDFVKAYDTVNFINGQGTIAKVETDAKGQTSKVSYDVNVDGKTTEITGKDSNGNKVVKIGNKFYSVDKSGKVDKTKEVQASNVVSTAISAKTTQLELAKNQDNKPTGKIVEPTGNNAESLVNAGDIAKAINNAGFNILASAQGGKVTGENKDHLVKAGEKVELIAGDHITIEQKGGKFTFSTNTQSILNDSLQAIVYTKADGTKVYKQSNGDFTTGKDGSGEKVKPTEIITAIQSADGSTTEPTTLTNLAGNLDGAKVGTTSPSISATLPKGDKALNQNNAASVGDVLNAGFNLQNNGKAKDFIKAYDTVNFVNGAGTTANVSTNSKETKITFNVNADNQTIRVTGKAKDGANIVQIVKDNNIVWVKTDTNGNPIDSAVINAGDVVSSSISAKTIKLAVENRENNPNAGKVIVPEGKNAKSLVNAGDIANAINSASHKITNKNTDTEVIAKVGSATIKAGSKLTVETGKNLVSKLNKDGLLQISTANNVNFDNVQIGDVVINKNTGINAGNKQIKGVKAGTAPNDAVNVAQLNSSNQNIYKAINNVDKNARAGIAGSAAMAMLAQPLESGEAYVTAGVATHRGESALAVGLSTSSDNNKWIVKGALAVDSQSNTTVGASVSYKIW
ncbi:Adhesin yadA precursor [Phocoenobacter uteri]|uniref:Adhesin yadA n=1 Tax=Phocoenobacter uteri TaxID=146806 RepID=A0A379CCQ8_9PAST|nr:YadA-like family protein [Phocoenobacter uteri]MDG6881495.1 hypothetical protein [Phocoenobacter uteri]SUB59525.1 Adhesin yadA precursor [Phocoenobacter uteri]